ncbi:MAG: hypothetical protein AAF995_04385 [Planctomycetota bacterium]
MWMITIRTVGDRTITYVATQSVKARKQRRAIDPHFVQPVQDLATQLGWDLQLPTDFVVSKPFH